MPTKILFAFRQNAAINTSPHWCFAHLGRISRYSRFRSAYRHLSRRNICDWALYAFKKVPRFRHAFSLAIMLHSALPILSFSPGALKFPRPPRASQVAAPEMTVAVIAVNCKKYIRFCLNRISRHTSLPSWAVYKYNRMPVRLMPPVADTHTSEEISRWHKEWPSHAFSFFPFRRFHYFIAAAGISRFVIACTFR